LTSLKKLIIHDIQLIKAEARILLFQLSALPADCDLLVYGHGLEGAAELRADNERRKDKSGEKLKCSDCKQYKLLNQFLTKEQVEQLQAEDFSNLMAKSMRGRMRCLICMKKRKDALDRAMGRTIQMIKYGISAPRTRQISSLVRMNQVRRVCWVGVVGVFFVGADVVLFVFFYNNNAIVVVVMDNNRVYNHNDNDNDNHNEPQFVSPEVVQQRNRVLARNNATMKAAAMATFNS